MKPRILLVTDPAYKDDAIVATIEQVAPALPPGTLAVQLRDKKREAASLRAFATRLRSVTTDVGAWLVINGDATLAHEVGADGVHLGAGAGTIADARKIVGSDAFISVAAHSDDAVLSALDGHADAVLVSPIFASHGKGPARGVGAILKARTIASGDLLVYALGGVDPANAAECVEAGADGVAVIRALLLPEDPAAVARAFHQVLQFKMLG